MVGSCEVILSFGTSISMGKDMKNQVSAVCSLVSQAWSAHDACSFNIVLEDA